MSNVQKGLCLCPTCGQAIAVEKALSNPYFSAVAEPAQGAVTRLEDLAVALTTQFGRPFTTKRAGRLLRGLGLHLRCGRWAGKNVTLVDGYRLRPMPPPSAADRSRQIVSS